MEKEAKKNLNEFWAALFAAAIAKIGDGSLLFPSGSSGHGGKFAFFQ